MAEEKNIKAVLAEAIKKRDELNTFIKVMQEMMGSESTGNESPGDAASRSSDQASSGEVADPLSVIYPGMFFGRSQTQAARLLLERVRRPLKTKTIIDCLAQGGMTIGGKNPSTNLWGVLKRHEAFVLVPNAGWGLADWYDVSVLAKMKKFGGIDPDVALEGKGQEKEKNGDEK